MRKKWYVGVATLMGILLLSGCGSQSSQSSTKQQAADKGQQTSQSTSQSSATAQSQSTQKTAKSSGQTQSKALWDSKRDAQLTAFIKQWEQTMGQSYDKYDGKTPLETLSGTFPADLGNESVNGQTNVLGWSPDGLGNNTYNVVAIYNYVGTELPLPNHIAYFFAFHDGQPVVIVDQSRDGGPRASFTKNTDLKTNFEKIAASGGTTSSKISSNTAVEPITLQEASSLIQKGGFTDFDPDHTNPSPSHSLSNGGYEVIIAKGAQGEDRFKLIPKSDGTVLITAEYGSLSTGSFALLENQSSYGPTKATVQR